MGLFSRNRNRDMEREHSEEAQSKSEEDKRLVESRMASARARLERLKAEVQTIRRER